MNPALNNVLKVIGLAAALYVAAKVAWFLMPIVLIAAALIWINKNK